MYNCLYFFFIILYICFFVFFKKFFEMKKVILFLKFFLWRYIFNCWNRFSIFVSLEFNIFVFGINIIIVYIDVEFLNILFNEIVVLILWVIFLLLLKFVVLYNFVFIFFIGFFIFIMFGYKVWEIVFELIFVIGFK